MMNFREQSIGEAIRNIAYGLPTGRVLNACFNAGIETTSDLCALGTNWTQIVDKFRIWSSPKLDGDELTMLALCAQQQRYANRTLSRKEIRDLELIEIPVLDRPLPVRQAAHEMNLHQDCRLHFNLIQS